MQTICQALFQFIFIKHRVNLIVWLLISLGKTILRVRLSGANTLI